MGSIELTHKYPFAPTPAYKISKAAVNMLTKQWALDFAKEGFTFITTSPGVHTQPESIIENPTS